MASERFQEKLPTFPVRKRDNQNLNAEGRRVARRPSWNSLLSKTLQVQLRSVLGAGNDSEHEWHCQQTDQCPGHGR